MLIRNSSVIFEFFDEAWQIDQDGLVTEGTSTNAWIVTADRAVVTRQADSAILNGVTRLAVFEILGREGLRLVERPFTRSVTDVVIIVRASAPFFYFGIKYE